MARQFFIGYRYRLQATRLQAIYGGFITGCVDWNDGTSKRRTFFFSHAVHIGFFTRPGRTVFGLMMSGPRAGRQHLLFRVDGERKRGATDKPFWIGFTTLV